MSKEKLIRLGFNEEILNEIYNTKEPLITLVILSYVRYEYLLKTLDNLLSIFSFPANISLTVQGARRLDAEWRKRIEDKCKEFNDYSLVFTERNHGTGKPRRETLHRALEFNTPYIMFTDDDMLFKEGTSEALMYVLKKFKDVGAAAVTCHPNYGAYVMKNPWLREVPINRNGITYADAMGSATSIMKREVFDTCDYDENYYIGFGDFDLCFQMRKQGWKCVVLGFESLKAVNTGREINTQEYTKVRRNKMHIENSRKRFKTKWRGVKFD